MATEEPWQEEQGPLPRDREAVDWWLTKWGRTEPLTGADVKRLVEVNGGTAEGLFLMGRNLQGANLPRAELQGAYLGNANLQGAHLWEADLRGTHIDNADLQDADLSGANLQGADLGGSNFQGADLMATELQGAHLWGANLQGVHLSGANFAGLIRVNLSIEVRRANMEGVRLSGATITETTKLRGVRWGERMTLGDEVDKRWGESLNPYRDLKQWHQRTGDYDTADRFQYREWECKRKLAQREKRPWGIAELWLYRLLSGYGGRPWRVVLSGAVAVLLFTFLYMLPWVAVDPSLAGLGTTLQRFGKALYFSGVSFTAVGYGGWVVSGDVAPAGWTKYLGVVESLVGISLIALFLVTFTRKLVR